MRGSFKGSIIWIGLFTLLGVSMVIMIISILSLRIVV